MRALGADARSSRECPLIGLLFLLPMVACSTGALSQESPTKAGSVQVAMPALVMKMQAPVLDGVIGPDEWKPEQCLGEFIENYKGEKPKAATRAWVGHDEENIYLAFQCDEPMMAQAARQKYERHDAPVWNNENVQVFLDTRGDRKTYIQFIVDILNQRYDALGQDSFGYDPAWRSAVAERADGWSVEIAIPFSALVERAPAVGDAWSANLYRDRHGQSEISAWRATFGSLDSLARFGALVFDSLKAYLLKRAETLANAPAPEWPEAMKSSVSAWQARHRAFVSRVKDMSDEDVRKTWAMLDGELAALARERSKMAVEATRAAGREFAISPAYPYEPYAPAIGGALEETPAANVTLLRGEWADLAWNVENYLDRPLVLRFTVRYSADDSQWDYLALGMPGFETLWQQALPVGQGDGSPVYDAIVPLPAGVVQVPARGGVQVWLSIRAPDDAAAGSRKARIVVEPVDGLDRPPVTIPIEVATLDRSLTDGVQFHAFTWNCLMDPVASDRAWMAAHLADLRAHGIDVCEINGLRHLPRPKARDDGTLRGPLDFTKLDRLLDVAQPLFNLYYVDLSIIEKREVRKDIFGLPLEHPAYEKAFKAWFSEVMAHLLARGLTHEQMYFCPHDESVRDESRMFARWMREVDPETRIIFDTATPDMDIAREANELANIWVPHWTHFQRADMKPFMELIRASGKPVWCYFYCRGGNEKSQHPTSYYIAKFWWAYANDVKGLCYWAQQYYGDPWYRVPYKKNYDTSLVYPVPGGVVPSRRWQAWRQGWQDYCLISQTARALAGDEKGLAELKERVDRVVAAPENYAAAAETRAWCKRILSSSSSR